MSRPFLTILVLVLAGALQAGDDKKPEPKQKDIGELIAAIPSGPLEEGVFLQCGEIKVMLSAIAKVESAYVAASKRQQPQFTLSPEHRAALRKDVGFRFLINAVLEKYVADQKIEAPKEKFEAQFEKFKEAKRKQDNVSYEQFLADQGLTDEEFRRFWQANWALSQKLSETVTEEEITQTLNQYNEQVPLRRAAHILYMYKGSERAPATVTRSKEEARAAAEDTLKKLKAGEDFAKLAQAGSDCPSKTQGGDLNFFPRKGAMAEPFAEATYKLEKVGDYTAAPVETSFGFHIIKLTEMRKSDDMKPQIRQHLGEQKMNKQLQQLIEEACAVAKFNEKMVTPPPGPSENPQQKPSQKPQPGPSEK